MIAHPECPEALLKHAEVIASTSGLIRYVAEQGSGTFIVLTETGIGYRLRAPD